MAQEAFLTSKQQCSGFDESTRKCQIQIKTHILAKVITKPEIPTMANNSTFHLPN